jgi:hypothetical protein
VEQAYVDEAVRVLRAPAGSYRYPVIQKAQAVVLAELERLRIELAEAHKTVDRLREIEQRALGTLAVKPSSEADMHSLARYILTGEPVRQLP